MFVLVLKRLAVMFDKVFLAEWAEPPGDNRIERLRVVAALYDGSVPGIYALLLGSHTDQRYTIAV
jgi:hypothetical protein